MIYIYMIIPALLFVIINCIWIVPMFKYIKAHRISKSCCRKVVNICLWLSVAVFIVILIPVQAFALPAIARICETHQMRQIYHNAVTDQKKTLDKAFVYDDTPTWDEVNEKKKQREEERKLLEEEHQSTAKEKLHFEWGDELLLNREKLKTYESNVKRLYYAPPSISDVPKALLSEDQQQSLRQLGKELIIYNENKSPKEEILPDDQQQELDAYEKIYAIRVTGEIAFQIGRVSEDIFWTIQSYDKNSMEDWLLCGASSIEKFELYLKHVNREVQVGNQWKEIYNEDILFRNGKVVYSMATTISNEDMKEHLLCFSYGIFKIVSDNDYFFSKNEINRYQALACYYRALTCVWLQNIADKEFAISLCDEGIDYCEKAAKLWEEEGYLKENDILDNNAELVKLLKAYMAINEN